MWTADRVMKGLIALIAVAMSLYHVTIAFIGAPQALFFRGTHLLFALVLVFLIYPSLRKRETSAAGSLLRDDAGGTIGGDKTGRAHHGSTGFALPPRPSLSSISGSSTSA